MRTFLGSDGKPHGEARRVLADLKRLSKRNLGGLVVSPITRTVDIHATMHANGRREIYDRVISMLGLDDFDEPQQENDDDRPSSAES